MRFEIVKWAYDAAVKKSSTKFVLVLMASHADALDCFNRTEVYIADKTSLNRKTVIKAVADLVAAGFIVDTGKRCGRTSNTKIYQLIVTKTHQDGERNGTNNGTVSGADTSIKLSTSSPKNGTLKQSQKRDSLPSNSPKNGTLKQSQKRYSVLKDLLYIKIKPQLNLKAWELWITHLRDRWPDEFFTVNAEHLVDVQISLGDQHKQMFTVKHAINKKWKHLHPIGPGVSVDGNKAISNIRQSAGLNAAVK